MARRDPAPARMRMAVAVMALMLPAGGALGAKGPALDCGAGAVSASAGTDEAARLDGLCTTLTELLRQMGHEPQSRAAATPGDDPAAGVETLLRLEMRAATPTRLEGRLSWLDCRHQPCRPAGSSPMLDTSVQDSRALPAAAVEHFLRNLLRLSGWPGAQGAATGTTTSTQRGER